MASNRNENVMNRDGFESEIKQRFQDFLENFNNDLDSSLSQNNSSQSQASNLEASISREKTSRSSRPDGNNSQNSFYISKIEEMKEKEKETLLVDFSHVSDYSFVLANSIELEFLRLEPFLKMALFSTISSHFPHFAQLNTNEGKRNRDFSINFYNVGSPFTLRQIDATRTGQLCSITGVITRTSDVRPELYSATFRCSICNFEMPQIEQDFRYVQPKRCGRKENEALGTAQCSNTESFDLIIGKSKFKDWQRVLIQEHASEIPAGSLPRSIEIILRGDLVEKVKPGERANFVGSLIAVPDVSQLYANKEYVRSRATKGKSEIAGKSGIRRMGVRQVTHKLCFACYGIEKDAKFKGLENSEEKIFSHGSEEMNDESILFKDSEKFSKERLINAIAPEIMGHEDVKKGLLLMLLGGVEKLTHDNIHLRGDINILLVGDPSTAKSKLLKSVQRLSERAVYTSGKASSAAGLTASVVKDPDTGEFSIQAGAMMLADGGVCCIDEFDKMDPKDQSSIHEAMEQQTVTITKAGVHATMNAKTSILAACNPVGGRYDRSKNLKRNIEIGAAILSRFDLVFVMLDECDEGFDRKIAKHILEGRSSGDYNWKSNSISEDSNTLKSAKKKSKNDKEKEKQKEEKIEETEFHQFLAYAQSIKPIITNSAKRSLIRNYREMREASLLTPNSFRPTIRQLESLLRLSEAFAKLDLSKEVKIFHVEEAANLLRKSFVMVRRREVQLSGDLGLPSATLNPNEYKDNEENNGRNQKEGTLKLNYEDYEKICNAIILHMHKERCPKTMNELVKWYVEELSKRGAIEGTEDTLKQLNLTRMVIRRMEEVDGVLLKSFGEFGDGKEEKICYEINPNFDIYESIENQSEFNWIDSNSVVKKKDLKKNKKVKVNKEGRKEKENEEDVYEF